ncbi:hypothetical protein [Pseudobacteriovorax antillogorgiicola]|uniref:Lipoprotein n=1 Tax=Pseudobacteriovorax antillogorgiicola TaxID=1513793 RepID=A0A1Y6BYR3_9BACT|nr:hypothetical protein [Pseudobacteriovorax antillogorgiicola]TCS43376.1 hypothetical protein EDD56_13716 [Pseudobacteriovorax antillogorgiicola]SMF35009.1 hypothetical protein SAMN06296036_110192 [Pseudobacteriovorax antillogorgiicola]
MKHTVFFFMIFVTGCKLFDYSPSITREPQKILNEPNSEEDHLSEDVEKIESIDANIEKPSEEAIEQELQTVSKLIEEVKVPSKSLDCNPVTLECLGYPVQFQQKIGPTFFSDMTNYGTQINQSEQKCNFARRALIYSFPDGIVYSSVSEDKYNAYSKDVVYRYGCEIPGTKNPYEEELKLSYEGDNKTTLASLGYNVAQGSYAKLESFADDMKKAKKITQIEHDCNWAVRPLIYIFPDAVVYTLPKLDSFNVFDRNTVLRNGCKF